MITLYNESLAKHSSFKTGGKADIMLFPQTEEELITAVKDYPNAHIMGNFSNTLVLDGGIDGGVIVTTKLNSVNVSQNKIEAYAGASLSAVAVAAREAGLTGCEFLFGIPGTVGGGVFMNAGAYGFDISSVLESVKVTDRQGRIFVLQKDMLELGYRTSLLMKSEYILISATFVLENGEKDVISSKMNELMSKRIASQPLDKPSCGSTFKRPEGHYAGKLIEDCGLKGVSVGGAMVSEKHAGFVINNGNATSKDILELIKLIKDTVFEKTGVKLTEEIRIIGHN